LFFEQKESNLLVILSEAFTKTSFKITISEDREETLIPEKQIYLHLEEINFCYCGVYHHNIEKP
jgi:hypothetical protein